MPFYIYKYHKAN